MVGPPADGVRPAATPDPAVANEQDVVATYWRRHAQWSTLARRLKTRVGFWRMTSLVLGAAGALLQTAAVTLGAGIAGTVVSVVGAVALVFVPFIARYFLTSEQVRQWLRARAMSEELKSLVFRFRARMAPFAGDDRMIKLEDAGKKAESWVEALVVELASVEDQGGTPPGPLDAEGYVAHRVREQLDGFYRPSARKSASRALVFRWAGLAIAALTAGLGGVAAALKIAPATGSSIGLGAWVAVLTTIGGAIAAHAAASRYDQQARVYFATARQLEDLLNEWTARGKPQDAASWSAFVGACEDAISSENRGWMAKLDPEEKQP